MSRVLEEGLLHSSLLSLHGLSTLHFNYQKIV